ncbi:MAG TPA: glycosyltransferase family 4 protein [Candidatus Elarobacter sp.]|nr:glycosyltransferase family 4 protein [Candidatus Elarobacter sp.]
MRILVAAERLGRAGGMERYLDVILPALVARGATVHVLARELHGAAPNGVTAEAGATNGVTAECIAWSSEHDEPSAAARADVQRALTAFAPDVAVAHNVMDAGVIEALRASPRLAYHVHDHRPFCPNGDRLFPRSARICELPLGRACVLHAITDGCAYGMRRETLALIRRRARLRDAVATADAVIVASAYMFARAKENGIAPERLAELPLPLPDDAYAAVPAGDDDDTCAVDSVDVPAAWARRTVVFAGRIVPQKGLDSLVRAVARIARSERPMVRAFGTGPALDGVRAEAARLGVVLDAPGAASPETVRGAMDEAALVALPSVWAEPFGYVGIEAFARGRTVVAYDVGGVAAWLENGVNGWAVRRADETAFGNAIEALVRDNQWRRPMERNARRDAEKYRAAPIVDALLSAYLPR